MSELPHWVHVGVKIILASRRGDDYRWGCGSPPLPKTLPRGLAIKYDLVFSRIAKALSEVSVLPSVMLRFRELGGDRRRGKGRSNLVVLCEAITRLEDELEFTLTTLQARNEIRDIRRELETLLYP